MRICCEKEFFSNFGQYGPANRAVVQNLFTLKISIMNQKNHALVYGLIGGLLSVAASLVLDLTGLVDAAAGKGTWLSSVVSIAIFVWALFTAIRKQREDLGGTISFGGAFKVAFVASVIIALIGAAYMLLYANFINPDFIEEAKQAAMEQMAAQGQSDEQIEQAMEMTGKFMTPVMMAVMGFIGSLIMGVIISLIGAAILKKEAQTSLDA